MQPTSVSLLMVLTWPDSTPRHLMTVLDFRSTSWQGMICTEVSLISLLDSPTSEGMPGTKDRQRGSLVSSINSHGTGNEYVCVYERQESLRSLDSHLRTGLQTSYLVLNCAFIIVFVHGRNIVCICTHMHSLSHTSTHTHIHVHTHYIWFGATCGLENPQGLSDWLTLGQRRLQLPWSCLQLDLDMLPLI
jgi:hypothetical protein